QEGVESALGGKVTQSVLHGADVLNVQALIQALKACLRLATTLSMSASVRTTKSTAVSGAWLNGKYASRGKGLSRPSRWMLPTTPTTVNQGLLKSFSSNLNRFPRGSSLGQKRWATASLMMATGIEFCVSAISNSRPLSRGICMV